ncbi:hypothetical protein QTO34_017983 [Cnephaeus nilssonii]|uniref:Thioredoxin, mitochondrial n=1 Tax=Cnephaeus nilssonii TaxID=3371016 RepID=A0AA40I210_CNENI|nr:hypothetical protein QTO34_017983 [Eptesicus nilssonii]
MWVAGGGVTAEARCRRAPAGSGARVGGGPGREDLPSGEPGSLLFLPLPLTDGSATSPEEVPGLRHLQEPPSRSVGTPHLQGSADPQHSPGDLTVIPSQARPLYTTRVCSTTFNIQDGPDFQDRVVNSETPVVVDFHAQWCGPCKILGPRLEKVVAKQDGKVVMAKVDIDDHTDLAIEYEVSAVPTVLAIKNGDVVDKFVGIKDEDQLEAFMKKLIA